MDHSKRLYPSSFNPLLIKPTRPLPQEVAVIGAGTIGLDIGYSLKSALPNIRLYLVDILKEALLAAERREVLSLRGRYRNFPKVVWLFLR
jgi:enoyl-CoA hydratase/3-hydroxyacyl-CoA dehydrogenase